MTSLHGPILKVPTEPGFWTQVLMVYGMVVKEGGMKKRKIRFDHKRGRSSQRQENNLIHTSHPYSLSESRSYVVDEVYR